MDIQDGSIGANFGTGYPTGVYKVTVRAKDTAGNWSAGYVDYLVVYNPFGTRVTSHVSLRQSIATGDRLPGLNSTNQADLAKVALNVYYDDNGIIHRNSDFQLEYATGTDCNKPALAVNCRNTLVNATEIQWLAVFGANSNIGLLQAKAAMSIDGVKQNAIVRIKVADGSQARDTADAVTISIYSEYGDPSRDTPIYQITAGVPRGSVKVVSK